MEKFQEVAESQETKEESKDASATAGLLEKLSVDDKKDDEKAKEESKEEAPAVDKEDKGSESKQEEKPDSSTWGQVMAHRMCYLYDGGFFLCLNHPTISWCVESGQ